MLNESAYQDYTTNGKANNEPEESVSFEESPRSSPKSSHYFKSEMH